MPLFGKKKKDKGESNGSSHSAGNSSNGPQQAPNNSIVFRVTVPENVRPGEEFSVYAGSRIVRVKCPPDSRPGQSLQITVPADPQNQRNSNSNVPDSPNVTLIPDSNPAAYMVAIPDGMRGGQQFPVTIAGQQLMVTCPANIRPGMSVRIVPPPPPSGSPNAPRPNAGGGPNRGPGGPPGGAPNQLGPRNNGAAGNSSTQMFEVVVPKGVQPGAPFALLAGGQRVLVTCPPNATPGQKIRFQLPIALLQAKKPGAPKSMADVKLSYDKDGWTRTIRVTDMKFQWIRMDDKGDVDLNKRFDVEKSAYVRKLDFMEGADHRIRSGNLTLVPASEAVVDSKIKGPDGRSEIVSYSDIAQAQIQNFDAKTEWFFQTCAKLCVEWNEGHMRMNVRRDFLLTDSIDAVMSLSRKDLRKVWRFEFIGEVGIDAGGLAREWFQLVTSEIFDPQMGLWHSSAVNQMCMQINPASEISCPDDHLLYFRFLGRVMGKAMFDRQLVSGHMVQNLYKHLLGWPVTFDDLEMVDEEYYNNLKQLESLAKAGEDISMMCLDFTVTEEILGQKEIVELVPGGADIEVDNDNFPEYLEACLKYRMLGRVKPQLNELLLGFFDVIPEPLLTIFDFQELELLMCGLPTIDLDDWMEQTEYSGEYDGVGGDHPTCKWFWQVVGEFDSEMQARLLQFVTGTSGVPARGFGVLQGNDGNIRKFTIHGVELGTCLYPRAHTCFNRIDLPLYESKDELEERLKLAVTMVASGFDLE